MSCCGNKERRSRIRLILFLLLTTGYFLVEVVVGHVTGSMALVADAFHMLSDIVALVIAYISMVVSPKRWDKNTYGFARAEVLGALSNAVFLIALCFSILVEAIKKYFTPEEIDNPKLVLIVGCTGLGINLIGLLLFHDHGHSHGGQSHSHGGHGHSHEDKKSNHGHSHLHEDEHHEKNGNIIKDTSSDMVKLDERSPEKHHSQMNIRGVFLHVLGDALGSVVVIISALVVWLTDWEHKEYVDPSLSILIVIIIVSSTLPLLKESSLVLLQTVPDNYQVSELKHNLLVQVPQITDVHEFHVWRLVGDRVISTLHASLKPGISAHDQMLIARNIKNYFHRQGIHSTTVQLELSESCSISDYTDATKSLSDATSRSKTPPPSYESSCILMCPASSSSSLDTLSENEVDLNPCAKSQCCAPIGPLPISHSAADQTRRRKWSVLSKNSNTSNIFAIAKSQSDIADDVEAANTHTKL